MLESIRKLGELSEDVPEKTNAKELVNVIFDLDNKRIEEEVYEISDEVLKKFNWIGVAKGNRPQVRLTVNLNIKRNFIIDTLKYIEENEKLFKDDKDVNELKYYLKEIKESGLLEHFKKFKEDKEEKNKKKEKKENILVTVSVKKNNKIIELANTEGYKKILRKIRISESEKGAELKDGFCHVCEKEGKVLPNPDYKKGSLLSIYVIDKMGFLSEYGMLGDESMLRTHSICEDCKLNISKGLSKIEKDFLVNTKLFNIYIIPSGDLDEDFIEACKRIKEITFGSTEIAKTLDEIERIEEEIDFIRKEKKFKYVSLNLIFGKSILSYFDLYGVIEDVPPYRFIEIAKKAKKLADDVGKNFKEERKKWYLNFDSIREIIPLQKDLPPKPLIDVFEAIIKRKYFPIERLIKMAVLTAKIHRYGNYEPYTIKKLEDRERRDEETCRSILKYNILILMLNERERGESLSAEILGDEMKELIEFCRSLNYDELKTSLFLLGVLIAKIGYEQYKKGDEKKSILDKIDFDGMSAERVISLFNKVFEGLRNYRILTSGNEIIFSNSQNLLNKNIELLKKNNPVENVFYILSGYSYQTLKILRGRGGKEE